MKVTEYMIGQFLTQNEDNVLINKITSDLGV